MRNLSKRTIFVICTAVILILAGTAAYAQTTPFFPDVVGHWAHDSIIKLAGQGIILGDQAGNFRPDEGVSRAQVAVMLDRTEVFIAGETSATVHAAIEEAAMAPPALGIRRGCEACHAGQFSLKNEAVNALAIPSHEGLPEDAGLTECLACHGADGFATSMRSIVHPVHMFSGIFAAEFRGNCFSCHEVDDNGVYLVLAEAVELDEETGIPNAFPIPGALEPTRATP